MHTLLPSNPLSPEVPFTRPSRRALKDHRPSGTLCSVALAAFPNGTSALSLSRLQSAPYPAQPQESATLCTLPLIPTGNLASVPASPLILPKQISHVLQITQSGDLYWNFLEALGRAEAASCQEARPHLPLQRRFLLLRLLLWVRQGSSPVPDSSGPCLTLVLVAKEAHLRPVFKTLF